MSPSPSPRDPAHTARPLTGDADRGTHATRGSAVSGLGDQLWFSTGEVARLTGIAENTLSGYARRGLIRPEHIRRLPRGALRWSRAFVETLEFADAAAGSASRGPA